MKKMLLIAGGLALLALIAWIAYDSKNATVEVPTTTTTGQSEYLKTQAELEAEESLR